MRTDSSDKNIRWLKPYEFKVNVWEFCDIRCLNVQNLRYVTNELTN